MAKHVTMPCGWGCGERLTARQIRAHFSACILRPREERIAPPPKRRPAMRRVAKELRYEPMDPT